LFQQYKKRLPLEQRNIDKLTLFDLYKIEEQINKPSLEDNQPDEKFGSDVKVWYNGPLGYLITPLTKEAAIKYSKGTKWCTGAEHNNRFDHYNFTGSLFIWKDKNGEKYQFHIFEKQYMNAQDDEIPSKQLEYFKEHPILKNIFDEQSELYNYSENHRRNNIYKHLDEMNNCMEQYMKKKDISKITVDNLILISDWIYDGDFDQLEDLTLLFVKLHTPNMIKLSEFKRPDKHKSLYLYFVYVKQLVNNVLPIMKTTPITRIDTFFEKIQLYKLHGARYANEGDIISNQFQRELQVCDTLKNIPLNFVPFEGLIDWSVFLKYKESAMYLYKY